MPRHPKKTKTAHPSAPFDTPGTDTAGRDFASLDTMWAAELPDDPLRASASASAGDGPAEGKETGKRGDLEWYTKAKKFWEGEEASVDGMLGGLGHLSEKDVDVSRKFLEGLVGEGKEGSRGIAIEVGAGIGRLSKHLLLPLFSEVDMLEPCQKFLDASAEYIGEPAAARIGRRFCVGMEDWQPEPARQYAVVWVQWCVIYLTDEDFVGFLRKAAGALAERGWIVVKDNVAPSDGFVVDKEDSSITRTVPHMRKIFADSGLVLDKEVLQKGFPKNLFSVKMFALRRPTPEEDTEKHSDPSV